MSLYFSFFSSEKAVGKRWERRGGYGSNALKIGCFLCMYPLLFCLFSVYFLFKKGYWKFCFIGGKVGRKKEKKGIADYGYVICICHLRDFIIPIYGEIRYSLL